MHKYHLRLLGLAIAFMLPAMAMAAPPEPASGITATIEEDGKVVVRWNPIENQARARIYWSYISILENNGEYDDFAVSEGDSTEYILEEVPAVDTLYVAVILENTDGEQSPFFIEEASVELAEESSSVSTEESSSMPSFSGIASSSATTESSVSMQASSAATSSPTMIQQDGKFHLLSAQAPSANEVVLMFSHPVLLNPAEAASAFTIATSDGRPLALFRLELLADRVTITTDTQERGVPYIVTVGSVVQGVQEIDGRQMPVMFPNFVESANFIGNGFGKEPLVPVNTNTDFRLQTTALGNGLFRVESILANLPHDDLVRYDVYQSIDGGRTFSGPQSIDAKTPSVRVDGVVAGAFVMTLQPIAADGSQRQTLVASVILGGGNVSLPSSVPTISASSSSVSSTVTHVPSTSLPGSGAGIVTLLGAGSAWTMMRMRRRKVAS